jgi:hypothetical protein
VSVAGHEVSGAPTSIVVEIDESMRASDDASEEALAESWGSVLGYGAIVGDEHAAAASHAASGAIRSQKTACESERM